LSQKLQTQFRLHHPWEFRRFFNQSQIYRLSECVVFRVPNDLGHFRLGITLKARGSSISRNQVKRQIREFFRIHQDRLGSFDYNVVVPKTKKMTFPYPNQLRQVLNDSFFQEME
jgi:ribonuclease P protein component